MLLGRLGGTRIDAPVFRMHHFQTHGAAARFAEAADARAARESVLLLRGEVEKPQRQKARTVGDLAEHLPAPAKYRLGEQHLTLHRRALPGPQFPQRHDTRSVLVAQRQEKQEILSGLDSQGAQPQGERIADAAQHRDRLE